jgi:hypothetical protein
MDSSNNSIFTSPKGDITMKIVQIVKMGLVAAFIAAALLAPMTQGNALAAEVTPNSLPFQVRLERR